MDIAWKDLYRTKGLKLYILVSFLFLLIGLILFSKFVFLIEERQGVVLNDPLLSLITPIDLTWVIFTILYLSLITTIIHLRAKPVYVLIGTQTYIIILAIRTLSLYFVPLDPPASMILLADPIVGMLSASEKTLTRDLFFSGHTATLFLFYLISSGKLKLVMLALTICVAACVLLQHVHYTIDVMIAFFVAYTSFRMVEHINRKFIF